MHTESIYNAISDSKEASTNEQLSPETFLHYFAHKSKLRGTVCKYSSIF